jgi:CelD/BcsL family acetyltransferase involved in cellulose biosynthesis
MLDVAVIDRIEGADTLATEWRALLARTAAPNPMQTPLWNLSWWRVFGGSGGRQMRIVTVREHDGGALIGVAPMVRRMIHHRYAVPIRRLELMGNGEDEADEICSDFVGVIAVPERASVVAHAIVDAIGRGELGAWDEVVLPAMSGGDAMVGALAGALSAQGATVRVAPFGNAPFIPLPATWDAYVDSLGGQDRYLVTRSIRDLERWAGPDGYALVRARTADDLALGLGILRSLHAERWSSRHGGVFTSERFNQFHEQVMPTLLADGALDLSWLTVHGRPIAVAYNVTFGDRVYFYQSGRALDVPRGIRPGIALHALAIRRAIAEGMSEYDFLNGDSQYKTQLALASRPLVTLHALAPTMRARMLEGARDGLDMVAALATAARGVATDFARDLRPSRDSAV